MNEDINDNKFPALRLSSFCFFSTFWALGHIFHLTKYSKWQETPLSLSVIFFSFFLLLKTGSLGRLLIVSFLQVLHCLYVLPVSANHWFFAMIINLYILFSWFFISVRKREFFFYSNRFYLNIRSGLIFLLFCLYFITGFHKLNFDFFDIQKSCSVIFSRVYRYDDGFFGEYLNYVPVVLTLLLELGICFLLFIRRLSFFAVISFLCFHLYIGYTGIFDFSTLCFAILFSLYSPHIILTLKKVIPAVNLLAKNNSFFGFLYSYKFIAFVLMLFLWPVLGKDFFSVLWFIGVVSFFSVVFWHKGDVGIFKLKSIRFRFSRLNKIIVCFFFLIIAANGLSPYFGLKTITTFSMFSNLRIGLGWGSNHLVFKDYIYKLSDDADDWVEIIDSNDSRLSVFGENKLRVAYLDFVDYLQQRVLEEKKLQFRSFVLAETPISVNYIRNGVEYRVDDVLESKEIMKPIPWWKRKFISFRHLVPKNHVGNCQW